jgi:hypothetical protein
MRRALQAPVAAPRPIHLPDANFRCCLAAALTSSQVESVRSQVELVPGPLPRQAVAVEPVAAVHRQLPAATAAASALRAQQPAAARWLRL